MECSKHAEASGRARMTGNVLDASPVAVPPFVDLIEKSATRVLRRKRQQSRERRSKGAKLASFLVELGNSKREGRTDRSEEMSREIGRDLEFNRLGCEEEGSARIA